MIKSGVVGGTRLMRALSLLVALLLGVSPTVAHSEPEATQLQSADARAEARRYFQAGVALQKTDDFAAASEAYATSLELFATKSALFNLSNCQRAMHLYAEAWHSLHRLHEEFGSELEEPMLSTSKAQMEELENLTGLVTVETQPIGAAITVDGEPVGTTPLFAPVRLTIGAHTLVASADGYVAKEHGFKLSPKQTLTVALELTAVLPPPVSPPDDPAPAKPPPTNSALPAAPATQEPAQPSTLWPTVGWVGVGLGAVAVAIGARNGVVALDVDARLADACDAGQCSRRFAGEVERLERLSLSANVFIGAGAVLLAAGATLVLWPTSATEPDAVTLTVSPTGAYLGGRF